jgi:superfamily II DNA/RNA helicase
MSSFLELKHLGLVNWLIEECNYKKICFLTNLQQACIPAILEKKDVLVFSRTGTGKTLAFVLPLIHVFYTKKVHFSAFILTSTFEISLQISEIFKNLGKRGEIECNLFYKGQGDIQKNLKPKSCLISTLKYMLNIIIKKAWYFRKPIDFLVLDEADTVLKISIFSKFSLVLKKLRPSQILIFGLTLTKIFYSLINGKYKKNLFVFNEKSSKYSLLSNSTHEYIICPLDNKLEYLKILIFKKKKLFIDIKKNGGIILIFTNSKKQCVNVFQNLNLLKIKSIKIHKGLNKAQRIIATQLIKTGKIKVLISTDIGSRGLDLPDVKMVINLDFPNNIKTFLHRIGRTSRFFKRGKCLNLISRNEMQYLNSVENFTGITFKGSQTITKKEYP